MSEPTTKKQIGQDGVQRQAAALNMLTQLSDYEAVGVAAGILLQASYNCPHVLRRVLNEPVIREGFRGESLATTLARVARS